MDNLPIPKSRSGWAAALINTMILFFLYYSWFFGGILDVYKKQLEPVYFDQGTVPLKITISRPKSYDSSGVIWVFINVENKSNDPINDVEVFLITHSSEPAILLPNLYNNDVYNSGLKFVVIEPQSIATGRIRFIAQTDPQFDGLLVKANGITEKLKSKATNQMDESKLKAFQQGLLETLLLPPLSNGFIFALALFSAYIVKKVKEDEEPELFAGEFWALVYDNWKKSAMVLVLIILLIASLVYEFVFPPLLGILIIIGIISVKKPYKKKANIYYVVIGLTFLVIGILGIIINSAELIRVKVLWGMLSLGGLILAILSAFGSDPSPSTSHPSDTPPSSLHPPDTDNSPQSPESPSLKEAERIPTNMSLQTPERALPPLSPQNSQRARVRKPPKSKSASVKPTESTERDVPNLPDQTSSSELPSGDEFKPDEPIE